MTDAKKSTIGELEFSERSPVYRRADDTTWMKLNDEFQVPATLEEGHWEANGQVAKLDPKEVVDVLHLASEKVT